MTEKSKGGRSPLKDNNSMTNKI